MQYVVTFQKLATNVDRAFIETCRVEELFNKNINSYFIVDAKENSEVMNSTIANLNVKLNSNILIITNRR